MSPAATLPLTSADAHVAIYRPLYRLISWYWRHIIGMRCSPHNFAWLIFIFELAFFWKYDGHW
jgi:hypothetical protein